MKPQGISSLVDQQQVCERKNRGERDSLKSWAEKSVWSLVCAMELGLISEPSLKSVSFADGSLAKTSAPLSKEFPSIDFASRSSREAALEFAASMSAQPSRKPSRRPSRRRTSSRGRRRAATRSTGAKRNVRANCREERADRARNATVDNFWKSCKRKLERSKKRENRDCGNSDSAVEEADREDRFFDRTRSVDLAVGIGCQAFPTSVLGHREKRISRTTNAVSRARVLDRALRPKREGRLVSKGRARKKKGRGTTARAKVGAPKSPASRGGDLPASNDREEEAFLEDYWDCDAPDRYSSIGDSSLMNDRDNGYFRSTPVNHESACELVPFDASTTNTEDDESNSRGSFVEETRTSPMEDVDALPLAERISNGSKSSLEYELDFLSESVDGSERSEYLGISNDGSKFGSNEPHAEEPSTDVERQRRSTKPTRTIDCPPISRRTEKPDEGNVLVDNDTPRLGSVEIVGGGNEKQSSAVKRSKIAANESAIGAAARDAARTDTIRAKIFRNDEEYHDIRRVTRGSTRISKEKFVGKLVWGYCSGWWPALIIDADHVGMLSEAGKLWVYWIGEARISLLNEKTQIEPFSCNLKYRLTQTSNVARLRVIDATMQMLRKRLSCTLTKPYSAWIENNFSEVMEVLDEIKFYPYPARVQQRLDHLKDKNAKVTEKYLLDQKRESQAKRVSEKPKEPVQPNDVDLTRLPLREQHPGVVTWAKIAGHNWWPAMIIDYRDCCMREPSFGCQWIMWYGDYKLSEVHHQSFLRFDKGIEKMRDYIDNTKKHVYLVGVLQASKDYCFRFGCDADNWTLADVFKHLSKSNHLQSRFDPLKKGESAKIYDKYSAHIVQKLNELKNNPNIDDKRADDIKSSDDLRFVTSGEISLKSLCLKCLKVPRSTMEDHPFFEGSLCKECSEQYKPCMFVFGNDAKCFYCTVCASSGTVIICDNEDCPRVYCTACMKHLLCPTTYDEVLLEDPWECFLCKSKSGPHTDTIVRPRPNWKDKIIDMFRTNCNSKVRVTESCFKKRKIRVLSLFDGLSTGLLVLLKLGLVVDVYYASEIDPDALMVSASHFGDRIVHLGDVRDITKEKIKEMAPIDLLIGGSPCNDLSLANPARLGLYDQRGTGVLFFEYCRIMKLVKKVNNGRHLFWMYENVASMPSEYRLEINKHLGQEPDVIDSADFSPQHRLRLYWHNLPIEPHSLPFQGEQDVQDILTPHCQRYALVKKIRTVTTKVNSLKQGKLALKPILMKDESDSLWITELEEIFGFPRHYTDVKNLSATKRQRLIGKSWSVQTLTAILRSLCSFFECNIIKTS